ncbi:hypothetical protein B0H13DRAFT_2347914 [Mycena leptocephala]|nr:hypothetical protein B0H13DRAFT_2347914 [Mycena leptocephala]
MEPPPYDSLADAPLLSSNDGPSSEPPAYDGRLTPVPIAIQLSEPREFTSEIPTGDGTPWAILTIQGDRRLSKTMPTVLEGSNLVGSVKFLLQSSESIHAVCILIRGELLKGKDGAPTIPFFESKHTLWPVEGTSQFSSGRLTIFRIQYVAELRVLRGKLRPDDKVARTFGYFSMQRPGPPSALRQLSLATPLSYTRRTYIPCSLTIDTEDMHAFDLLTTPAACMVYLERISRRNDEKLAWTQTAEPCGQAVFHPSTEGTPDYSVRRLMGEIHLRADLQPSFAIFRFRVEV